MKAWQIAYARRSGFTRLVTCSRKSNRAMIALNKKYGFVKLSSMPRYYHDPVESAIVMERVLD
jgi:ribosomal protein S18 acetylase RimI-like enzyme